MDTNICLAPWIRNTVYTAAQIQLHSAPTKYWIFSFSLTTILEKCFDSLLAILILKNLKRISLEQTNLHVQIINGAQNPSWRPHSRQQTETSNKCHHWRNRPCDTPGLGRTVHTISHNYLGFYWSLVTSMYGQQRDEITDVNRNRWII
jgi:hypothetical protein